MANIAFTKNYTDHSNPQGYQFEFHCDKCGSGFRSSYAASTLGMASGFLRAAGDMFGGVLGSAANAGDHLKDALRGKAWDAAFAAAIEEIKPRFRQCRRCGQWVCPEVCWNASASLCKGCAPALQEEAAAAAAQSAQHQIFAKAEGETSLIADVDLKKPQVAACPHCNAALSGPTKFCGECGKPIAAGPTPCAKCRAPVPASSKFCPECGAPKG